MSRPLTRGIEVGERNLELTVTEAVVQGQWEVVCATLNPGVRQELVTWAFQQVVAQDKWGHVPRLVAACSSHVDFALQAAVGKCKWDCVRQLITLGLTPAQQEFICNEALEWGHFDCALELLRQGCGPQCAHRIVREALKWKQYQGLVQLFKEVGVDRALRHVVLNAAKNDASLDQYLEILQCVGAREVELVDVITRALRSINVQALLKVLSFSASARRVFKQVMLKTKFPSMDVVMVHTLIFDEHPDLAFHMFVAQKMWGQVVGLYKDARLSQRARRFALRHAIRKRAWKSVKKMALSRLTSRRDCRYAFLQAVRRGKWRTALKLSARSVTDSDRLFALRTWLKLDITCCFEEVNEQWGDLSVEEDFTNFVLVGSIIGGNLELFVETCSEMLLYGAIDESVDTDLIHRTAVEHNKCNFVLRLCSLSRDLDDFKKAIEYAVEYRRWDLVGDLMGNANKYMYTLDQEEGFLDLFVICSKGVLPHENSWHVVVPNLDVFCRTLETYDAIQWDFNANIVGLVSDLQVSNLVEWCLQNSCGDAGLLISAILGNQESVTRVLHELGDDIESEVYSVNFVLSVKKSDWGSAVTCLEHLAVREVQNIVYDFHDESLFVNLIRKCLERQMYKWAVYLGVFIGDWENASTDLFFLEDTDVIDDVVRRASSAGKWGVVRSHLDRSSQKSSLLDEVLRNVVRRGHSETFSVLIQKEGCLTTSSSKRALLQEAVQSSGDREKMLKLCISHGLSTHTTSNFPSRTPCFHFVYLHHDTSPMRTVLSNGQLPLVKLLHKTGGGSNEEMFRYKQDSKLNNRLRGQNRHDIVQYLEQAATTPRTLQDLCRLRVSHHIGCRPGRTERIMSLELPWPAKSLVKFEDVL